jgi:hypothetical protein
MTREGRFGRRAARGAARSRFRRPLVVARCRGLGAQGPLSVLCERTPRWRRIGSRVRNDEAATAIQLGRLGWQRRSRR